MKVVVIGAGPSGLACAASLKKFGIDAVILERSGSVGQSWAGHYAALHLHTSRGRSALPHKALPKHLPRYVSRADFLAYVEDYARSFDLKPRFHSEVKAVRQAAEKWQVVLDGETLQADAVVLATGLNGTPFVADFPGKELFQGKLIHSSDYHDAQEFEGKRVLVVGFGNSGGDIAVDLSRKAAFTALSVRGPMNILPKELFSIPITSFGLLRKLMPYRIADMLTAPVLRAKIGRAEDYGLKSHKKGPAAQVIEDGRIPLIDVGALPAIKAGKIAVRGGIERMDETDVTYSDGHSEPFDAIVLATGYRNNLGGLLEKDIGALDQNGSPISCGAPSTAKGLYFCSYHASFDGQLRQSGIEARQIARDISRRFKAMGGV